MLRNRLSWLLASF